ncbi:MAG: hypothetical protein E6J90_09515 [Deltaproteobacteria bacterium]|nr:MAG: hypothetical protein E6J90_09515 [Deltaproteobacteria bacterium]
MEVPREFDDYVIGRELGRGATGTVYLAEDAMLARPVAIKFIARLDPGARQRFLLEARAIAQIHHPNVVGIYRIGKVESRTRWPSASRSASPAGSRRRTAATWCTATSSRAT